MKKFITINMSYHDQYYNPLQVGSTVMYKGELHTIKRILGNSNGADFLRLQIEPVLVLDPLVVNDHKTR